MVIIKKEPSTKTFISKPSTLGTQRVTFKPKDENQRRDVTSKPPSDLNESTVSKDNASESDNPVPPILRKNPSVLPSLGIPLAAFPSREIPKNAPPNAVHHFQELFEKEIAEEGRK